MVQLSKSSLTIVQASAQCEEQKSDFWPNCDRKIRRIINLQYIVQQLPINCPCSLPLAPSYDDDWPCQSSILAVIAAPKTRLRLILLYAAAPLTAPLFTNIPKAEFRFSILVPRCCPLVLFLTVEEQSPSCDCLHDPASSSYGFRTRALRIPSLLCAPALDVCTSGTLQRCQ